MMFDNLKGVWVIKVKLYRVVHLSFTLKFQFYLKNNLKYQTLVNKMLVRLIPSKYILNIMNISIFSPIKK